MTTLDRSLGANEIFTHTGDCRINGDIGAGARVVVTGGSLTINGAVGSHVEILVVPAADKIFHEKWDDFLGAVFEPDMATRRALAREVRAGFNAAAARGLIINGPVGLRARIACAGDVRLHDTVGENPRLLAGGTVYATSLGERSEIAAGGDIRLTQTGSGSKLHAEGVIHATYLGADTTLLARGIVGAEGRHLPRICPQGSHDIRVAPRTTALSTQRLARLKR